MNTSPPKPRFRLFVGVIGHRPNRLSSSALGRIVAQLDETLALIAKAAGHARVSYCQHFTEEPPSLTLVSALAEGADRIAAAGALENGYALTAILPFSSDEYSRDFKQRSSKLEYQRLLKGATTKLALPGERAREALAYKTAGLTIVDNVDILLAVWDGGESAGSGGTTELIERAAKSGLPIIRLDAKGEQEPRVIWSGLAQFPASGTSILEAPSSDLTAALPSVVERIVRPPQHEIETTKLSNYLDETWKPWNWRLEFPLLFAILGLRPLCKTDLKPKSPDTLAEKFQSQTSRGGSQQAETVETSVLPQTALAYGWADALGTRYAQIFRGAYTSNFVCAALVVLVGITSLVGTQLFEWSSWPWAVIEIALVVLIFVNTRAGQKRDWHSRWRESREVAERLRAAELLSLVALSPSASRANQDTWVAWYVRSQKCGLGVESGTLDKARLEEVRRSLIDMVESQCAYHSHNAELMRGVERRIEHIGYVLLGLTILFATINAIVALSWLDVPEKLNYLLMGLPAALPALAAATFGIRLIGDFEGIAARDDRTSTTLSNLVDALQQDRPDLAVMRSRARSIVDTMLGDVAHWRMTTETRKLVEPV